MFQIPMKHANAARSVWNGSRLQSSVENQPAGLQAISRIIHDIMNNDSSDIGKVFGRDRYTKSLKFPLDLCRRIENSYLHRSNQAITEQ